MNMRILDAFLVRKLTARVIKENLYALQEDL